MVTESNSTDQKIRHVEEKIVDLLKEFSNVENIDYYLGDLIIDVLIPNRKYMQIGDGGAPNAFEWVEVWDQQLEIVVSGDTIANTDWNRIRNGELQDIVRFNVFDSFSTSDL